MAIKKSFFESCLNLNLVANRCERRRRSKRETEEMAEKTIISEMNHFEVIICEQASGFSGARERV